MYHQLRQIPIEEELCDLLNDYQISKLKYFLKIDRTVQKLTRLEIASKLGDYELVNVMIERGVTDLNWGLIYACSRGNQKIAKLLIEHGATCLELGLMFACSEGHIDIVQLMIQYGATNFNDGLKFACTGAHEEIIDRMIQYGAHGCAACIRARNVNNS